MVELEFVQLSVAAIGAKLIAGAGILAPAQYDVA
jgi:hypothetical protein